METVLVRPPLSPEARAVAALMREAMSPKVRRITILGSAGLHHWVADQLASTAGDSFLIAVLAERIVGMVSSRLVAGTLVLNHLYTHVDCRRRGVAHALLRGALDTEAESVAVDVFSESKVARSWYASLGMTLEYRRLWIETALPAPTTSAPEWNTSGLEEANAAQARQGFSHFRFRTARAEYAIARLGDAVYRCAGFDILADPAAPAGLASLDSQRSLVCVGPPESASPAVLRHGRLIEESERLRAQRADLAERLARW
jgi:GNAT superfamily N-acetyltransferase